MTPSRLRAQHTRHDDRRPKPIHLMTPPRCIVVDGMHAVGVCAWIFVSYLCTRTREGVRNIHAYFRVRNHSRLMISIYI